MGVMPWAPPRPEQVAGMLTGRFPQAVVWLGETTGNWWAMVRDAAGLDQPLEAASPAELERLLEEFYRANFLRPASARTSAGFVNGAGVPVQRAVATSGAVPARLEPSNGPPGLEGAAAGPGCERPGAAEIVVRAQRHVNRGPRAEEVVVGRRGERPGAAGTVASRGPRAKEAAVGRRGERPGAVESVVQARRQPNGAPGPEEAAAERSGAAGSVRSVGRHRARRGWWRRVLGVSR
ncbi:hypothetical protein DFJ69_2598 [Thermomonospora umbrina]|uniref:Uncharacterized protein n=1 Tax=Thermomonospora umbrina TaxID=111806 RepID=A0A3D9SZW5_9ACTN|nr:hypothetical protein DFJ69_2598 [Thermomonospora umbrina]